MTDFFRKKASEGHNPFGMVTHIGGKKIAHKKETNHGAAKHKALMNRIKHAKAYGEK